MVGVARSETPFTPGKTSLQLHAEYAREALVDVGPRQVDGAGVALVHGVGGVMSNHATAILGRG